MPDQSLNWLNSAVGVLPVSTFNNAIVLGIAANARPPGGAPLNVCQLMGASANNVPWWYFGTINLKFGNPFLPIASGIGNITQLCAGTINNLTYIFGLGANNQPYMLCTVANDVWNSGTLPAATNGVSGYSSIVMGGNNELFGIATNGIPQLIAYYASSSWNAGVRTTSALSSPTNNGGLALSSLIPQAYSQIVPVTAGGKEYVFGLATTGSVQLLSVCSVGSLMYASSTISYNAPPTAFRSRPLKRGKKSPPPPPPSAGFSSLLAVPDGNGAVWLIGLIQGTGIPYAIGKLTSTGTWTAVTTGLPNYNGLGYSQIIAIQDTSTPPTAGIMGIGLNDGLPYLVAYEPGGTGGVWTPGEPTPAVTRLGQPVTFSSLTSVPGSDGAHCLGIGTQDGQLYEIAVGTSLPEMTAGQGLLRMSLTGSARLQAEILGSCLLLQPALVNEFLSAMGTDMETPVASPADPPVLAATDRWVAQQNDVLLSSFFNCGAWDVLLALAVQYVNNISFWTGCYGAITAGSGWPSGTAPSYLLITPDGSVFYGNYNLSGVGWTFAAGVLTWGAPTSTSPPNAPPARGTIEFGLYTPDNPGPNGYLGPYFTGTLNGMVQQPASGQPALPAFPAFPAVQSVTSSATTTPLTPGESATVTVTLNAPAPNNGVLVSIYVSGIFNWLAYPDTVLIPAGQSSAPFTITFVYPFLTGPNGTFTQLLTVVAAGGSANCNIQWGPATQITDGSEAAASTVGVSVSPNPLVGGGTVTLTLTLSPAPTSNATYMIVSNPSAKSGSSTITVNAGQTSAKTTLQYSAPPPGSNNINATVNVYAVLSLSFGSASFVISPAPQTLAVQSVMFDPPNVTGGDSLNMTVALTSEPSTAQTVTFTSSDTNAIPTPPSLTIPANTQAMSQSITSKTVTALAIVTIGASLPGTTPASTNVSVLPAPAEAELSINPETVQEVDAITATLNFAAPAQAAVTFTLTSSDTNVANPSPAVANVAKGAKIATWNVVIGAPQTPETITLQAFAQNYPDPIDEYAFTALPDPGPDWTEIGGIIAGSLIGVLGIIVGVFLHKMKKRNLTIQPLPPQPSIQQATTQANRVAASIPEPPTPPGTPPLAVAQTPQATAAIAGGVPPAISPAPHPP